MKKFLKITTGILATLLILVLVVAGSFLAYLSFAEYKPDKIEILPVQNARHSPVANDQDLCIMTWNIGYGALGRQADFFMDGGKSVDTATSIEVQENLQQMAEVIKTQRPNILLLQEVDELSSRSGKLNQIDYFDKAIGTKGNFAANFKAWVPYPWPPIGRVNSGLYSNVSFPVKSAERLQLPVPFKWPIRTVNLKRCLLIQKLDIANSDKQLVIINLHLEAYDDTGGREEQTEALLSLMKEEYAKGNYVIAAGDWNQAFPTEKPLPYKHSSDEWEPGIIPVKQIPDDWNLNYGDKDKLIPTCRLLNQPYDPDDKNTVHYIIDGFLTTPNIEILSTEVLNLQFENSDHNPLVMRARLLPQP